MLGALLAVGFGAAWWSFIPYSAVAATEQPPMGPCLKPEPMVALHHETAHVPLIDTPVIAEARKPIVKPVRKRRMPPTVVIEKPEVVAVHDPVIGTIKIDVLKVDLPPVIDPVYVEPIRIPTGPS